MLPSIAASSSGHWNQDGSRRWQRATRAARREAHPGQNVAAEALDQCQAFHVAHRRPCRLDADGSGGKPVQDLLDQEEGLLDLVDAQPHAGIDVTLLAHRHLEAQVGVGGIARLLAGIEGAARGAADEAAGSVLACQFRLQNAGGDGAVLHRGGAVVELDQLREAAADGADERRHGLRALGGEIGGDAARHHAVHHQAVAEADLGDAQDVLAQDAEVGVDERERGVVADGADVAEVVGCALQLRHQRAQIDGAGRGLQSERGLDGAGEGQSVGDRAVAGDAGGELGRFFQRRPAHQRILPLVHVAQPLLQAHYGLAVAGEAEMPGLDDAGMHGADGDLVQRRALGGVKGVGSPPAGSGVFAPRGWRTPQRP